ncbi:MAG: HAMP domain-containing sensor histidine kinase [Candidatus Zixiibacteriota bacterium]
MSKNIVCYILFSFWLVWGTFAASASVKYCTFDPIDDPTILKYRFVPQIKVSNSIAEFWMPIKIDPDGKIGLCTIGNNWRQPDSVTAIVFRPDPILGQALRQVNLNTVAVFNVLPFDFDNDGVDEVAFTYGRHDSLWLEILHPQDKFRYIKYLGMGTDRDHNGYWDGSSYFPGKCDINGDGFQEILVGIDTGYDLYPRKMICLDWRNDKILWEYEFAGIINLFNTFCDVIDRGGKRLLILGFNSKGNAAVMRDMDDRHSYVIALNKDGEEEWKIVTGGTFTGGKPVIIDYNGDGITELLVPYFEGATAHLEKFPDAPETGSYIMDLSGDILQIFDLGEGREVNQLVCYDIDNDGADEIFASFKNNFLSIYDQALNTLCVCSTYADLEVWDCFDFLGIGDNQLLLRTADKKLTLTDLSFQPLAQLDQMTDISYKYFWDSRPQQHLLKQRMILNGDKGQENIILSFGRTPWQTVFSRKPLLAFLAAFVPLSLIIAVIWLILAKFRQKNKIISSQRDQINDALQELKRTQEKLIAAEKYKQAKGIAGGVAHEIHNALSPALNSLDKLGRLLESGRIDDAERVARLIDLTGRAINRANNMTQLVTRYSRLDLEKSDDLVNLKHIIENVIEEHETIIQKLGVSINTKINDGLVIRCFEAHAYSLINNIFINALDAMTGVENRLLTITAQNSDNNAHIEVEDSGSGIPEENIERIFDVFFSTKPSSGTGLGLAIVKKIVDLYNGSIQVHSSLDMGTKFIILLPLG